MLFLTSPLREISFLSVFFRFVLAILCGGLIGIEREYKRRPAGFRTHILICMGAAITTMTGQYLLLNLHYYTDITRLGAQVVAGVGFIGAGTIVVTHRQRVKGLTTAAGLWGAAIIGLALGAGFYEGGLFATALILLAELLFSRIEYRILNHAPEINLYVEYAGKNCLEDVLRTFRTMQLKLLNIEITRNTNGTVVSPCAIFTLRMNRTCKIEHLLQDIQTIHGVKLVEKL